MAGYRQHAAPKPPPGPWAELANCLGLESDLFFPGKHDTQQALDAAREVCGPCVVREECLEYALTAPVERIGVWGGTGVRERERILRRRKLGLAQ